MVGNKFGYRSGKVVSIVAVRKSIYDTRWYDTRWYDTRWYGTYWILWVSVGSTVACTWKVYQAAEKIKEGLFVICQ